VLGRDPANRGALLAHAEIFLEEQDPSRLDSANAVLAQDPENLDARHFRTRAHLLLKQYAER